MILLTNSSTSLDIGFDFYGSNDLYQHFDLLYQTLTSGTEYLFQWTTDGPSEPYPWGGGYSLTLPIRVCAASRSRDFEAPDLERGIHFRDVF